MSRLADFDNRRFTRSCLYRNKRVKKLVNAVGCIQAESKVKEEKKKPKKGNHRYGLVIDIAYRKSSGNGQYASRPQVLG
ncbi:hypothetical protein PGT21_011077 [Puccinia graminis f. sp. tritici]|uniref:Uncharacterized protein n=1 Tax=Puccinia graminis f. sp. tritici TaxID=56615 RepID=A0A5B0MAR1_PUCGR|nr:hypothetical protein PGT21_011077 [Puccinia graminis f. sp. tritici]